MTKRRKLAIIFLALYAFITIFSAFFLLCEADHDCEGEECPICHTIGEVESCLKVLSVGGTVAIFALLFAVISAVCKDVKRFMVNSTPVMLKVKLSN